MDALRKRHHYGTTGNRIILDTHAEFDCESDLFADNPDMGGNSIAKTTKAMMGDIIKSDAEQVNYQINIHSPSPIERIDIRNGTETLETFRPYTKDELGRRIRILWEGSEYRGRGRETIWDGYAELTDNEFVSLTPINRYNLDKKFEQLNPSRVEWTALTTGGFGGFDAILQESHSGHLRIETNLVKESISISDIGLNELIFENGGINRRIRIFRLPDVNSNFETSLNRLIGLHKDRDNALYAKITLEDGHVAWSSPIYIIR